MAIGIDIDIDLEINLVSYGHVSYAGGGRGEGGGPSDGVEREQLGLLGQREVFEHARLEDEVGRRPHEVSLRQEAAIWVEVKIEFLLKMLRQCCHVVSKI